MRIAELRLLQGPQGVEALQAAESLNPKEDNFLSLLQQLGRRFPPAIAKLALEQAILRSEAMGRFPQARRMWFTRPALEQASSHLVAAYRAKRFAGLAGAFDLACSIGGDALALAEVTQVTGVDRDAGRLALAQANAQSLELAERCHWLCADLTDPLPLNIPPGWGGFFDPGRRREQPGRGQQRIHRVEEYQPPLSTLRRWLPSLPEMGVKLSPGVDWAEIEAYPAEVEFISLGGELKECVLWFGALRTARRRATLLPSGETLASDGERNASPPPEVRDPADYIIEPDAAILRASLVTDLAQRLGAHQIDEHIAYLTSDTWAGSPFARGWRVLGWMPFQMKQLRAELRRLGIGRLTVKKRGSPIDPQEMIQRLRLDGLKAATLFLTQVRGRPAAIWTEADPVS